MIEKDKGNSENILSFDYGAPDVGDAPLGAVYVDMMKMENIADASTIKQKAFEAVQEMSDD